MSLSSNSKAATSGSSSTVIRSQPKNFPSRETPTASFSTVSNALSVQEPRGGDLKKSDIHRKGRSNTTSHNTSTSPPFSLYYASIPTVSFDYSMPPSTTCTKRKHSSMESSSDVCDVKKKDAFMGKNGKRKDSPLASSKHSSVGVSLSKKQKASTVAGACSHAAPPPQYPYGHYPHYPYYYPYYPPPANMVGASLPPPPPGYTWPYPVAAPPAGYPAYYPPHYYPHQPPAAVCQPPAAVTSKHRDSHKTSSNTKNKGTAKSSAPTSSTSNSTPKESSHKAAAQPDSVPSSSCQDGSPSSFEPAKFPPTDITIHNFHNDSFDLHHTSSPTETGIDRREKKNAQSRKRAAKLKESIHIIKSKKPEDRTPEEVAKLETYEERRRRKNGRSRERALERKARFEQISAKPEKEWTDEERLFMKETLTAKYRKNEGDRLRRKKMRESGSNSSVSVASCAFSSSNVLSHSKSSAFVGVASASRCSFKRSHSQGEAFHRGSDVQLGGNGAVVGAAAPLTPKNGTELYDDDDDGFARIFDLSPRKAGGGDEKDSVSHLIFPSPSDDEERLIQSPTLELCAETSILDQNLEDIILSPHFATPRATVSADDDSEEEFRRVMDASFSPSVSPLTLRLLDLPRRSKPEENLYEDAFCTDWRGLGETDDSNNQHEPIAVSFSMDTI